MTKYANTIALLLIKIAEEKKKTYPFSRFGETVNNINSYGISGGISNLALQGRKNIGEKGTSSSENEVLSKIKKDDSGPHTVARTLTTPIVGAAAGAGAGALAVHQSNQLTKATFEGLGLHFTDAATEAKLVKGMSPTAMAATVGGAALLGGGAAILNRWAHSRALLGRAEKERKGWGPQRTRTINAIKR